MSGTHRKNNRAVIARSPDVIRLAIIRDYLLSGSLEDFPLIGNLGSCNDIVLLLEYKRVLSLRGVLKGRRSNPSLKMS